MEESNEYYCNESTYTNLNILFVSGLVRLDTSVAPASKSAVPTEEKFDAWPTKEQLKDASRRGHENFARMGLDMPDYYLNDFSDEDDNEDDEGDY